MFRNVKRLISTLFVFPIALGFTSVLIACFKEFSPSYIPFVLGIVCYTLTYPVFRKPLSSYVIGHELTHVLGIWLSRGRVYSLRIGRQGGRVKTDKVNVWTSLLPYFFPIYTFLVLCIYLLLSILWDMNRYYNWFAFILGITWAFHIWMTIYVLRRNQPDVRYSGVLFSMVIIFTANIIILGLLLTVISPEIAIGDFIHQSWKAYLWILKKLV